MPAEVLFVKEARFKIQRPDNGLSVMRIPDALWMLKPLVENSKVYAKKSSVFPLKNLNPPGKSEGFVKPLKFDAYE